MGRKVGLGNGGGGRPGIKKWGIEKKGGRPPNMDQGNRQRKCMHCSGFYYLINSVISKTILFMFHLPHQKLKKRTDAKIIPQGVYF